MISGLSKDPEVVKEAFDYACNRFGLKMTKRSKGTFHETWFLNTTYSNCEEVSKFLLHVAQVFINVSNGKVNYAAGWELMK